MKTVEEIQKMLDENVNVLLGQHRGRVDILSVGDISGEGNAVTAFVKMSGGCKGCAGARATLASIVTNHIKGFEPKIQYVIDSTDHTDKTNAFFKE